MRVEILFFGMLKDFAGKERDSVELADGATVSDLLRLIEQGVPRMASYGRSIAVSVNHEYAEPKRVLHQGDEVGLLPPVSGGADAAQDRRGEARVSLVRERIEPEKILAGIKSGADGAVVAFDGIVRDNSRGRRTKYLDYEAYEGMALKELGKLAGEAVQKFEVRDAVICHRLGRLYVGETSVLIAVASAHRGAAFEACRWIIDTLKKTVPIWKKEHFEDGAIWADGEAFPPEIGVQK
jgi:molybdopterin converting factor subunit 1